MKQSSLHLGIIMDGNGRWATGRGLPRIAGHRRGVEAVRRTVEAARAARVRTLTLYAFSSDNWRRPAEEVEGIMKLFELYLRRETHRCVENGIRLNVIGRRDRLAPPVLSALEAAERMTECGSEMHLRLAVDYSSRDMMLRAAEQCSLSHDWSREGFAKALGNCEHGGADAPDVDLLLRTGGEQRLSDFLLWECAYAEFLFLPVMWPDFDAPALQEALAWFSRRDRRFGAVVQQSQLLPDLHPTV